MRLRALLIAATLAALPAAAERGKVNVHLDPGVGTGLDKSIFLSGVSVKVDTTLIEALGPVAPQIEFFGGSAVNRTYLDDGSIFGVGIGARLRLFNDEKGYFFNPGTKHLGNLWGNLWVDAHFTYMSAGGPGFNVGLGYSFSLVEGLLVGPFAKFQLTGPSQFLLFGVSFTIVAPQTTPEEADYDGDGILGDNDKCIDEAEDKDGHEDEDGCPEKDNDKDGVDDADDKCPHEAGPAENKGCPVNDKDGDGVNDPADKCPDVKGPAENQGCPDGDKDSDGIVDRLDKCPDVKGLAAFNGCPEPDADKDGVPDSQDKCPNEAGPEANKGCPWPDTDKDGVADNVDNCPNEPGPADNQGCPAAKKQLVVITAEKLVIKDKVYFNTGKATLQKRSNTLLDQVASILNSHPEISLLQVEGHTDNKGDAAFNRRLSEDRAKAVVDYLVKKGVDAGRLKPVGFGPDRPADDNSTEKGRENNRRVEFNIIAQ
jgi:outer membrane protein OmpA-like peptidoglycan-associated protein